MPIPVRPRRRGLWLTIAGLTTLVVAASVGLQVYGALIEQESTTVWAASHPITAVDVTTTDGSVSVSPGAAGRVTLTQTLTWDIAKPTVRESWRGDTLVVSVFCASSNLFSTHDCGASLALRVPAATAVEAQTRSGDVTVQGIAGSLRLQASSGDIEAVGTSGTLWMSDRSGDVAGSGLLAASVTATTSSGSVDLQFAASPTNVTASVVSGDVTVLVPPGAVYRVFGQTVSGNRAIDPSLIAADSPRILEVDSGSGDVVVQTQGG